MEANSDKKDLHMECFRLRVVLERKISSMDFFFLSRLSVYLLTINQQDSMAAKWVECAASFFPLSPRRVPEMEKIRHETSVEQNLEKCV